MNYSQIKRYDIANGPGIRTSIWFTGCSVHCKGCFNYEIWNPKTGKKFDNKAKDTLFWHLSDSHCVGLSVLGGEPTDHDEELAELLKSVKEAFPKKDIWLWSGYTLHQLITKGRTKCFPYIDVLVDGPFIEEESGLNLKFKGSKNQNTWKRKDNLWILND